MEISLLFDSKRRVIICDSAVSEGGCTAVLATGSAAAATVCQPSVSVAMLLDKAEEDAAGGHYATLPSLIVTLTPGHVITVSGPDAVLDLPFKKSFGVTKSNDRRRCNSNASADALSPDDPSVMLGNAFLEKVTVIFDRMGKRVGFADQS